MVPIFTMSLHFFFSFMMTCMAMSIRAELTKVPLRPYLRGNPGLLPQAISSQNDISVVKGVEDCNGQTGCLLKEGAPPPELVSIAPSSEFVNVASSSDLVSPGRRFPLEALINQKSEACPENKDDDGDAEYQDDDDDDANDEDFSGEEGGDDDDCEGDPEEDPAANGNKGSDDDDDDDNDDEDGDDEEEEEDEEEDEDEPPTKKRK